MPPEPASGQTLAPAFAGIAMLPATVGSRKRKRSLGLTGQSVAQRRSAAARHQQQLREHLIDEEQVAQWIRSRDLAPSSGPAAHERIEALKRRLRDRQSLKVEPGSGHS